MAERFESLTDILKQTRSDLERNAWETIRKLVCCINRAELDEQHLREMLATIEGVVRVHDRVAERVEAYADGPDTTAAATEVLAGMLRDIDHIWTELHLSTGGAAAGGEDEPQYIVEVQRYLREVRERAADDADA